MIQDIKGVGSDLEPQSFAQPNVLGQRQIQLSEEWPVDRTPRQSAKLARAVIKENFSRECRLTKRRRSATIRIDHGWVYVINIPVLMKDADQVTDLIVCKIRLRSLIG